MKKCIVGFFTIIWSIMIIMDLYAQNSSFDGLYMNPVNLSRLSRAKTCYIRPENFLGGIGEGKSCLEGTGAVSHVSVRNKMDLFNEPSMVTALSVNGSLEYNFKTPSDTPEWFRRCPALYIPMPVSAGAVMLSFTGSETLMLPDLIDSFRDMPKLLEEARSIGTNTVYLIDYYQGWQGQPQKSAWRNKGDSIPPYMGKDEKWWFKNAWWNKGDYIPRADLGGAEAFKEGIAAVHRAGGRVIVYVEGFIISEQSQVGQTHGADWAILTTTGLLGPAEKPYYGNWKMCPACPEWVDYVVDVGRRLVGEYGVDGIHIDSFGAQKKGYGCVNPAHQHEIGNPQVFHDGRVTLARQVRAAIQNEKPDAVVMVELPDMTSLLEVVDGSQDWGFGALRRRPLWDKAGLTDVYTAGWSLDDIHQILAIGHKLSLGRFWIEDPEGPSCSAAVKSHELKYRQAKPGSNNQKLAFLKESAMILFKWWNAGVLLDLPMPDLRDLKSSIHRWLPNRFQTKEKMDELLVRIGKGASDVDAAFKDCSITNLPSTADHIKALMRTRSKLSYIIDDESTVQELETGCKTVSSYFFSSAAGSVLMVVNVSNDSENFTLSLPNGSDFKCMIDEQDEEILDVREGQLAVSSPAHSIRMFRGNESRC
jgi:hypothetical protein